MPLDVERYLRRLMDEPSMMAEWIPPRQKLATRLDVGGPAEDLPKMVGAAKGDEPFRTAVEAGYVDVPDPLRQLVHKYGYPITGAETLPEVDPSVDPNQATATTHYFPTYISIANPQNFDFTRATTAHEMGHALDAILGLSSDPEFLRRYGAEKGRDTEYASTNPLEGFAEMFATSLGAQTERYGDYPKEYPQTLQYVREQIANKLRKLQEGR